ncbi:MAG TPA: hypothetical protein VG206_24320 [Terriglobia bacterium]|nr:hypothetical protein [Terriglobia bacterium]
MIDRTKVAALTGTVVLLLGAAAISAPQAAQRGNPPADADSKEYRGYHLTMENVGKFVAASKALVKLSHDNPGLEKDMESQSDARTIEDAVRTTEKYPAVTSAIKSAGLTTRDFVVMTGTLMGAEMAVGMKKQGQIKQYPPSVSPENAAFVEQNWDRLNAMMKAVADSSGQQP